MSQTDDAETKEKGRPKGARAPAPRDLENLLRIMQLRDVDNLRWRRIGELMGMSHQGPYLLYKKWRAWFYDNYYFK